MATTITPTGAGDIDFDICRGTPPPDQATVSEVWTVPGTNGTGILTLGDNDGEFEITCVKYIYGGDDNESDAQSFISACRAAQGVMCKIDDDFSETYDNLFIKKVDITDCKKPCITQGDETALRIEIKFKLINLDT